MGENVMLVLFGEDTGSDCGVAGAASELGWAGV